MEPTAHLSAVAVLAIATHAVVCFVILLRRPNGMDGPDGLPSFGVTFMVSSAIGGTGMAVLLGLVLAGEITFAY